MSGIIFVLLAVAWAVFLIPKALRHHDEAARTRPIDRFSTSVRVVAHREPVNDRDTRLVVTPARPAASATPSAGPVPSPLTGPAAAAVGTPVEAPVQPSEPAVPPPAPRSRQAAARAAARRRRRILGFLLLCAVAVAAAAYLAYVPWWAVAVPGGLTLAYLVLCRTQVRHESVPAVAAGTRPGRSEGPVEEQGERSSGTPVDVQVEVPVEVQVDEHRVVDVDEVEDTEDTEDTVGIPVAAIRAALQPAGDDGTLWDPLPVTLPTYVTKAKASRTVRTIDLDEPGTWSSGHHAPDTDLATQAADAQAATEAGPVDGETRAVGS